MEVLLEKKLDDYTRVTLFLRAFKIRAGDKICKRYEIDLEEPDTYQKKCEEVKQAAMEWSAAEGSQRIKLFREEEDESDLEEAAPQLKS